MTQAVKTAYLNDQALSPDNAYGPGNPDHLPESACKLQCVEVLESGLEGESGALPPVDLLLEGPLKWIAERCPFGRRRQHGNSLTSHNDEATETVYCFH